MNTMNIPGFTAESALLPARRIYYKSSTETTAQGIVVPQLKPYRTCVSDCMTSGAWTTGECLWYCLWE
jgi:hypothetical protein